MAKLSGYYRAKIEAHNIIKKMALKGTSVLQIQMYIEENFGFSVNFTDNWLEKLELSGWIKVTRDKITPMQQEPTEAELQAEEEAEGILKK